MTTPLSKYPPQVDQENSVSLTATATADDSNATRGPTAATERQQQQQPSIRTTTRTTIITN